MNVIKTIVAKLFWGFLQYVVSDKAYANIRYWLVMGDFGNFEQPERFTEKIQHIKFYERTPLRKLVANRIEVRDYVQKKVNENILIPLFGVYDHFTYQDWEKLPDQFVLKANHGCGMIEIIDNKSLYKFEEIQQSVMQWQKKDYSKVGREWVYKGLPRKILAEQLLLKPNGEIPEDWKFFCFHGEVKIVQVDFDRYNDKHSRNLYDRNFKKLDMKLLYPTNDIELKKPYLFDSAIAIAEKLSKDFTFIRVDLYLVDDTIFFGELTNYPGNGFIPFQPEEKEYEIGKLLQLRN